MKENQQIKCKDCPYYTGIECHGHGEFWGECNILTEAYKTLKRFYKKEGYICYKDVWSNVRNDDSTCPYFTIDEIKNE